MEVNGIAYTGRNPKPFRPLQHFDNHSDNAIISNLMLVMKHECRSLKLLVDWPLVETEKGVFGVFKTLTLGRAVKAPFFNFG